MFPDDLADKSATVLEAARKRGLIIVTAESCTGGLISAALTSVAGSSDVFDRGFVTYSNASKIEMLGVDPLILEQFGAVSLETAGAMARGALEKARADIAISVTGIAGPGGGTVDKPVGTVCFGYSQKGETSVLERKFFSGNRTGIRHAAALHALHMLLSELKQI